MLQFVVGEEMNKIKEFISKFCIQKIASVKKLTTTRTECFHASVSLCDVHLDETNSNLFSRQNPNYIFCFVL